MDFIKTLKTWSKSGCFQSDTKKIPDDKKCLRGIYLINLHYKTEREGFEPSIREIPRMTV